jgi:hypothetical protein
MTANGNQLPAKDYHMSNTMTVTPAVTHGHSDHATLDTSGYCVALRVTETDDQPGGDVQIRGERSRVAIGDPDLILRGLLAEQLHGSERAALLDAVDQLDPISEIAPVTLERLTTDSGGRAVHIQALILPATPEQIQDLDELLSDQDDLQTREEFAWLYAEELAGLYAQSEPAGRLAVRFLDPPAVPLLHVTPSAALRGLAR